MVDYRVEMLVFANGERYPILIGSDDMPHFHTTLWVTTMLRNRGRAVQTITNKINHIKWFFTWQEKEQRDLYKEFQDGKFLGFEDIENIKSFLAIDIQRLNEQHRKRNKGRDKVVSISGTPKLVDSMPSVGKNHHYNRMTSVAEYLIFLANLAIKKIATPKLNQEIERMEREFKSARPKGKNVLDAVDSRTLPDDLVKEFMEVAHYGHPKNPFTQEGVKFRNHLMFLLMQQHGIRSGEMLSLQLTDMTLHGAGKAFWVRRTHDDVYDSRKKQRVAKTKERKLKISDETAELLDVYIREYRAKIPNAQKHPYLFVTHRKGKTLGQPISGSSFDNTIVKAMKNVDEKFADIHPHYFRHDWNEVLSKKVDSHNELAALGVEGYERIDSGKEAKMRMHQLGHSSEKSGEVYNQRHIARKANEVSLQEQEELELKISSVREETNKKGDINE